MRLYPKGGGLSVLIESTTSSGESYGLYDYEKKTKFNQIVTVSDECDSYILFLNHETGQLSIQTELKESLLNENSFDHNSNRDVKSTNRTEMRNIQDISMEFIPIIRLYLLKNIWHIEVIKDVNKYFKDSNNSISSHIFSSSNQLRANFPAFSRTQSFRGKSHYKEDNRVWIVAPRNSPGIALNKGDLLKFGRCKMLIHDIITTSSAAKDACSKVPYLPLMRQEDLSTSMESFLRVVPSVEVEEYDFSQSVNNCNLNVTGSFEQEIDSKYNLLDRVLDDCSKSNLVYKTTNTASIIQEDKIKDLLDSNSNLDNIQEDFSNLKKLCDFFDDPDKINSKVQIVSKDVSNEISFKNTVKEVDEYIGDSKKGKIYHKCCRICLSDDGEGFCDADEPLNPLICPCDCKGSLQYVHLQCLRTWLESRLEIPSGWFLHTGRNNNLTNSENEEISQLSSSNSSTSYLQIRDRIKEKFVNVLKKWVSRFSTSVNTVNSPVCLHLRKFDCELCKVSFPTQLRIKTSGNSTTVLPLFRIPRPKFPYMVLVPIEGEYASKMGQIVVSFGGTNTPVCIGRGHNSDIRLGEISVSRAHAQLQHCYHNSAYQVCLLDMKSKFGSLVEFVRPMRLGKEYLSVQIGKTLISFKTFKSSRSISNIIPCLTGCIGRQGMIRNVSQNKRADSKINKHINLTVDSSNNSGFGNAEFISLNENTPVQSCPNIEEFSSDRDVKCANSFRNSHLHSLPSRHSYTFDP